MKISDKTLWWIVTGSSAVGLTASLIQTIERINYALHPTVKLTCNINAIFSCSNVFDAWQSHVFGFANSLICMMFFGLTAGLALAGATGSLLLRKLRHVFHIMAVFFLGFGAWYLWESTYKIGYICIFCLFCYTSVILMNWAWFRLQYHMLPLTKPAQKQLDKFVANGGDMFVAIIWTIMIAAMIIFHFW